METELSAFVQILLVATVIPLATLVAAKALETFQKTWAEFKGQNSEKAYIIEQAIDMAVKAAEQSGLKAGLQKAGKQKLDWAVDYAEKYLAELGLKLDFDVIVAGIEARVFELNTKK